MGCVMCGSFCDLFGCVLSLQLSNVLWIGGTVVAVFLEYIIVLILGRLLKGISVGFISCLIPVYIFELFPPNKKGSSISVFHLSSTLGTVVIYFIGHILKDQLEGFYSFKATWGLEAAPAVLLMLLGILLPESPKWLASQSKWVEAAKTLERVRTVKKNRTSKTDEQYVTRVYTAGKKIKYCHYSNLFGKHYWRSTCVGILLHLFIQLTCVSTLMYFFTYICAMCGLQDNMRIMAVSSQYIILGILTLIPLMSLDKARRVDFLTYGILVLGFIFGGIFTVMYCFAESTDQSVMFSPFDWKLLREPASAVLALFLFLISVYASSITSVSWLYTSEIFPDEARAKGTAICMCVSSIVNATTTLCLPLLFELVKFWLFIPLAVFCITGAFVFLTFPETKAISDDIFISGMEMQNAEQDLQPDQVLVVDAVKEKEMIQEAETEAEMETPENTPTGVADDFTRIQAKPKKLKVNEKTKHRFDKALYEEIKTSSTSSSSRAGDWSALEKPSTSLTTMEKSSPLRSSDSEMGNSATVDDVLKMYSASDETTATESVNKLTTATSDNVSLSEESYFSDDWNQNQIDINRNSLPRGFNRPVHQSHDLESNNSDKSTTHLVGRKEIQPTSFLQFDTLRVALRNLYRESKPTNPIKKSKNMLRST